MTNINIDSLKKLYKEITAITGIEDVCFHTFDENEQLCPVYKSETQHFPSEHWKTTHSKLRMRVPENWVLRSVVYDKKTFYMRDRAKLPDAPDCFEAFGIDSILTIPLIKNDIVIGLFAITSIGKVVDLNEEQITACENLVSEFSKTR